MTTFKRISKREARRRFANYQPIVLSPCKMMPGFPFATHITVTAKEATEYQERAIWYSPDGISPSADLWKGNVNDTAWNLMYNNWAFFNTSFELGYYAHYYIEN